MVLDLSKYKFEAIDPPAANDVAVNEAPNGTSSVSTDASSKASSVASERSLVRKRANEEEPSAKRPKTWPGPLPPILQPGLKLVFVGFNPGVESGKRGHYYAHGSNRFWKMLFWSGLTPTLHSTMDDRRMPDLYGYGFTDLVARCTKGIQQLTREEMAEGVDLLDSRLAEVKPEAVCLVGKGIWEAIAKSRGWNLKKFKYGWDPEHTFGASQLYCVPSTSGLNSISAEKQLMSWAEVKAKVAGD